LTPAAEWASEIDVVGERIDLTCEVGDGLQVLKGFVGSCVFLLARGLGALCVPPAAPPGGGLFFLPKWSFRLVVRVFVFLLKTNAPREGDSR
jgi:hypothetical protein